MSYKQVIITEADVIGNKGAVAMVNCIVRDLRKVIPDIKIYVTSKYVKEGKYTLSNGEEVEILTDHQNEFDVALIKTWIRFVLTLFGIKKKLFQNDKVLNVYGNCDLAISTSGISFIDNFGIIKLYHYSKFLQIPVLNGVSVVKFTQSIGPFKSKYNKAMASLLFPHLKLIMARGRHTYENLHELGITENVEVFPDIAVTLDKKQSDYVDSIIEKHKDRRIIGVSPNEVCFRLDEKKIYLPKLVELIRNIIKSEPETVILLIPHTIAKKGLGNKDDFWLCNQIVNRLIEYKQIEIIETLEMETEEVKYLIGKCDFFIGSRFHSLIAATSCDIPTLAIGWHWKYEEMMEWIGVKGNLLQYWELNVADLFKMYQEIRVKGRLNRKEDLTIKASGAVKRLIELIE